MNGLLQVQGCGIWRSFLLTTGHLQDEALIIILLGRGLEATGGLEAATSVTLQALFEAFDA